MVSQQNTGSEVLPVSFAVSEKALGPQTYLPLRQAPSPVQPSFMTITDQGREDLAFSNTRGSAPWDSMQPDCSFRQKAPPSAKQYVLRLCLQTGSSAVLHASLLGRGCKQRGVSRCQLDGECPSMSSNTVSAAARSAFRIQQVTRVT